MKVLADSLLNYIEILPFQRRDAFKVEFYSLKRSSRDLNNKTFLILTVNLTWLHFTSEAVIVSIGLGRKEAKSKENEIAERVRNKKKRFGR